MRAVRDPRELLAAARSLETSGGKGFLLSGGCDARGRVPLEGFLEAVREIKDTTRLAVNVHPGLVDAAAAPSLLASGADMFSVDVLQDRRAIAGRLHLDATPEDYRRTLELLSPGRVVPHVCVGLQSEKGEEDTLDLLASVGISALVVLGLMAPPDTPSVKEVSPDRLLRFVREAVGRLGVPVLLGCMRPRGHAGTEIGMMEAGAAGIVNPSSATVQWAKASGREAIDVQACCALHL
jgi:uncharacterized radical SAM superfamily protein